MKNLTAILLLVFVPTILIGQNLKALDDKYGFRGAKFEMPFDSFKDLVEVEKGYFASTSEVLTLGEFQLEQVVYSFYKGQLYFIGIKTKGYINSTGVLKILQTAYGKGYQDNQYIEKYIWFGKKLTMSYDQNSVTDDATIYLFSKKLLDLEGLEKDKANAEAAKKL